MAKAPKAADATAASGQPVAAYAAVLAMLLLTDVSLSVRATARFTLHLVYGMQSLFTQARSFAFVDAPVEITELFAEHPLERALGLVFDGLPAGGLLDVDASSDYGATIRAMRAEIEKGARETRRAS